MQITSTVTVYQNEQHVQQQLIPYKTNRISTKTNTQQKVEKSTLALPEDSTQNAPSLKKRRSIRLMKRPAEYNGLEIETAKSTRNKKRKADEITQEEENSSFVTSSLAQEQQLKISVEAMDVEKSTIEQSTASVNVAENPVLKSPQNSTPSPDTQVDDYRKKHSNNYAHIHKKRKLQEIGDKITEAINIVPNVIKKSAAQAFNTLQSFDTQYGKQFEFAPLVPVIVETGMAITYHGLKMYIGQPDTLKMAYDGLILTRRFMTACLASQGIQLGRAILSPLLQLPNTAQNAQQ